MTASAPAQLNVAVSGAANCTRPPGLASVLTNPGSAVLSASPTPASRSGRPCSTKPKTTAANARAGNKEKNEK